MSASFAARVALNRRIADARTWQELIEIVGTAVPSALDAVCVATAFHRVAKLGVGSIPGRLEADLAHNIGLIESKSYV